ncbi:MAG: oligosaccharide flippase family protein [Clostridia bacterium]|nr:oligosaccharide flippase family protein [Clostridia bacterium]
MKNNVGRGAFVLVASGLVCKFFGGLFRLPLTNIIGIEGIGVFQMVISIYSLALIFVSGGVTNALSKLVSSARARGDYNKINSYLGWAMAFTLGISGVFALIFLLFGGQIAILQGAREGALSYLLLALLLPLSGLVGVFRGLLQGYENMTPTAISQVIQQVAKLGFGLIFAYALAPKGLGMGVFGAFLGMTLSEVFASFYLGVVTFKRSKVGFEIEAKKEFFTASLPLTFGGAVLPLTHAVEAFAIIPLLTKSGLSQDSATALYGLQTGVVGAILNFPLIISVAVAVSLLPNISYLIGRGEEKSVRILIEKAFSSMWFLLIPLVFGLIAVCKTLYPIIYPQTMELYLGVAVNLTTVVGISIICTAIMQFLVSILQASGLYNLSMAFHVIGGIAKIGLLFILAPIGKIGIFSIAISNIVLSTIVSACALIKLGGIVKISFFDIALPLLSAFVMLLVVRIFLALIGGILGLVLAVVIGMAIYFTLCLPLTFKYFNFFLNKIKRV